jgi:hypothetical protein
MVAGSPGLVLPSLDQKDTTMSKKQHAGRNSNGGTELEREAILGSIKGGTFLKGYKSELALFPGLLVVRALHRGGDGQFYWQSALVSKGETSHTLALAHGKVGQGYHFAETQCDCPGHRAFTKVFAQRVGDLARARFQDAAGYVARNEFQGSLPVVRKLTA